MSKVIGVLRCALVLGIAASGVLCRAQSMPGTEGETLAGGRAVLAQSVRGHVSLVICSFTREAGRTAEDWAKAVKADPAMAAVSVYQAVMLQHVPGFVRGAVKAGMRKDVPAADQSRFFVFTTDEPLWRTYFDVTKDSDPYIALIDAGGRVRWHGHGTAANLEARVRDVLP